MNPIPATMDQMNGTMDLSPTATGWQSDAKLSTKARKKLPGKAFALPGKRAYPIHDLPHARAALRLIGHASPAEQKTIRRKVYARYPQLRKKAEARKKGSRRK